MTRKTKSEKTVEIHEFYVIRTAGGRSALCARCAAADAIMVAPEQAAAVAQVPVRIIYRWVELGTVHFAEARDGSLMICLKSLPADGTQLKEL